MKIYYIFNIFIIFHFIKFFTIVYLKWLNFHWIFELFNIIPFFSLTGMFLVEEIALTNKVSGIDLVEINPDLGSQREQSTTIAASAEILYAFFGKRTQSTIPDNFELPKV